MTERWARITACGSYLPKEVLTNEELIERFSLDIDSEWIKSRTGIESRHWMSADQTTSDMVALAAEQVLENAGVVAADVDRIVLATISPDQPSPATAMRVARLIGARCPAFDLSAACAGFLYGLDLGAASIRGGEERVLVLAADARSRFVDPKDRRSLVLFADGAAGVLLEASDAPGLLSVCLGAEGRERPGAEVPAGGAREPASHATVDARRHFVRVDGKQEIFDLFLEYTREACTKALKAAKLSLDDIDLFICHQGNAHMVQLVLDDLGLPPERSVCDVAQHGNTSAATVPIALAEAHAAGRIQAGQRVLLTSVGAGYTFGAAIHLF
jgi:3-oxoacyl-[acyl-carrier-protein] synthase-3